MDVYNVFRSVVHVGEFYCGSFSTEYLAMVAIDTLGKAGWDISEFYYVKYTLDAPLYI